MTALRLLKTPSPILAVDDYEDARARLAGALKRRDERVVLVLIEGGARD